MTRIKSLALTSAAAMALAAPALAQEAAIDFTLVGVAPLGNGYTYEGWAIVGGEPVSTGRFIVNDEGLALDTDGNPLPGGVMALGDVEPASVEAVVLTIEPANDPDPAPSAAKYLGGPVVDGTAQLTTSFDGAFGTDFGAAFGTYILATPSNGMDSDELAGIWWLEPQSPADMDAGLSLPDLPEGWVYEGWAVIDGTPVSTGRFTSVLEADDFAGFSGDEATPPFPGEDFLANAPEGMTFPANLQGAMAVISVEPADDDDPAPFAIKPLAGAIPADAEPGTVYEMDNKSGGLPSGTATFVTASNG